MTETYLHLPTGELRPRHTDYGAQEFAPPDTVYRVATQQQLRDALKAAHAGTGAQIRVQGAIDTDTPLPAANNTRITGGTIRAAGSFVGNYMWDVRGVTNFWLDAIELDGGGLSINGIVLRECRNIYITDCITHACKTGIYAEAGASDITITGGSSHDNAMHGIAIDDKKCHGIAVLSARLYDNGAYGFDTHSTAGELAGCIIEGNGRNGKDYDGACVKLPEAVNWWLHDNDLRNSGSGPRGAVWSYAIERAPQSQMVYRNEMRAHVHFDSGKGGDISHCDNFYFTANGTPSGMVVKGPGRIAEDPALREMPEDIEDTEEPTPPDAEYVTAAEARQIALKVFEEQIAYMYLVYDPNQQAVRKAGIE